MCVNLISRKLIPYLLIQNKELTHNIYNCCRRSIVISSSLYNKKSNNNKEIVRIDAFENITEKNKTSYLDMVKIFEKRDVHRRGHVEFIYSALRHMKNFDVHKDLEVYKSLIDVLPKGKFIPQNVFQAEFMHYPKQQQCAIDLLQQMEDNGVMPDLEMEDQLLNIFGRRGYPLRKYWRMMYWMPKFKNLSPWPLPNILPNDSLELAKLAIQRMASVDLNSALTVYKTSEIEESIDDTWIVSAQSPIQQELLENHDAKKPVYVEGSFKIWIKTVPVNYFILRTDAPVVRVTKKEDEDDVSNLRVPFFNMSQPPSSVVKQPSVHEQDDGTILAICATGTSSRDSLLSWIRHLEKSNPALSKAYVVFTLKSPQDDSEESSEKKLIESSEDVQKIDKEK